MLKKIKSGVLAKGLIRVILLLWTLTVVYPVIWTLYSSLKNNRDFYKNPWALPSELHFENYYNAWINSKFYHYFANSFVVVCTSLVLSLIMATTTAYVLAKYKFKGLGIIKNIYIASMMIPSVLLLIPLFFQAQAMHLTNKLSTLVVLYAVQSVPFAVFMLIGFIKGVHNAFIEAAVIEGCSEFRVFINVVVPMIKSGIFIIAILNMMGMWNEYVMALTFLTDENKFTVPIGIANLTGTFKARTDFGALFAGLVIGMLPILVIYGIFQKQLQEGMASGSGVKG